MGCSWNSQRNLIARWPFRKFKADSHSGRQHDNNVSLSSFSNSFHIVWHKLDFRAHFLFFFLFFFFFQMHCHGNLMELCILLAKQLHSLFTGLGLDEYKQLKQLLGRGSIYHWEFLRIFSGLTIYLLSFFSFSAQALGPTLYCSSMRLWSQRKTETSPGHDKKNILLLLLFLSLSVLISRTFPSLAFTLHF